MSENTDSLSIADSIRVVLLQEEVVFVKDSPLQILVA